jgi:hypothetical protein
MKLSVLVAFVCAMVLSVLAVPAHAQATRTWVSGVGDDANPCSRTAPCKTFAGAISKTAAGGEIDVLDPGGFGTVTITKSITLDGSPGSIGSVLATGTNGINVSALATDVIILRNLRINQGTTGVQVNTAAQVIIENCDIFGQTLNGINVTPSTSTNISIDNTHFSDINTAGTTNGAVIIKPTGGTTQFSINRSNIEGSGVGVRADGTAGGTVKGTIEYTAIVHNTNNGVTALANTTLMVSHATVANNGFGIVVNAGTINTTYSTISGNGTGAFVNGTGTLNTYHTNGLNNNTNDGAFTAFISPQ